MSPELSASPPAVSDREQRRAKDHRQLSCGKLELLGRGQHFTGLGKHLSGADYEWQGRSLDQIEIEELPIISAAVISAFTAWAEARWPIPEKAKRNGDGRTNKGKADFRNSCLVEDVEAALKALPCDYEWAAWVKLGMAYRAGGGSYEVFLEWSKQHRDYERDSFVAEQWTSFKNPHSVTFKTLFAEVFKRVAGWKKPSERGTDYTGPADDDWDSEPDAEANSAFEDEALPLSAELREGEPYPLEALGSLQGAIEGIAKAVGCDPGLAAQSVLMTAALATAGIANVMLPKIGEVGLPLFLVTIARSSERKSSADRRATQGVKDRIAELVGEHKLQAKRHRDEARIYAATENQILKDKKLDHNAKAAKLKALGPEPAPLLHPVLASADMTVEGVIKEWARRTLRPVQALTTSEGGLFIAGAAMSKDMRLRTVTMLSNLWGCEMVNKIRAGDGMLIAGEKRLVIHFMIQPNFVSDLLGDPILRAQGFLSRLLIAWPKSRIGFRSNENDDGEKTTTSPGEEKFRRRIHALVSRYGSDELELAAPLQPDPEARKLWLSYSHEIETAQRAGTVYADFSETAGKSAEMAGRLAGVLTLYEKPGATTITAKVMKNAIVIARWYLNEALRIAETGIVRPEIIDAIELLKWFRANPQHRTRSGALLFGPKRLRSKLKLDPILRVLADHNLIVLPKKGPIRVRDED